MTFSTNMKYALIFSAGAIVGWTLLSGDPEQIICTAEITGPSQALLDLHNKNILALETELFTSQDELTDAKEKQQRRQTDPGQYSGDLFRIDEVYRALTADVDGLDLRINNIRLSLMTEENKRNELVKSLPRTCIEE